MCKGGGDEGGPFVVSLVGAPQECGFEKKKRGWTLCEIDDKKRTVDTDVPDCEWIPHAEMNGEWDPCSV